MYRSITVLSEQLNVIKIFIVKDAHQSLIINENK